MQLVTWNTQWCCGLDGVVSPERIVQGARALADFDVLCLQEIAVNYPALAGNAGHDQPALLAELLPGFQLFFGAAVDEFDANGERRRFGNLIATRLPVTQVQHHPLPYPADAGVRTQASSQCQLWDSWRPLHGETAHAPTFRLYDRRHGPEPVACDFVFVSDALKTNVRALVIDAATQASDHQPVMVELGA